MGPRPGHRALGRGRGPVHTSIADAVGTGGLLAHIDGRTSAKVAQWIVEQPDSWRAWISHVTIDLSASYLCAVAEALPHAVVVANRFHLVRLADDMLTVVRQRATREVRGRRGRKRDPEWAGRRKLLLAHERLEPAAFAKVWNALIDAGDPDIEVLHAYTVKESLSFLLALSGTNPDAPSSGPGSGRCTSKPPPRPPRRSTASPRPARHCGPRSRPRSSPTTQRPIRGLHRSAKHAGRDAFG